mgnify:CR=1 FL=1
MTSRNPDFSRRLHEFIDQRGRLTRREFADRVGANEGNVNLYFKNGVVPRWDTLVRICLSFGINAHWLLTGEGTRRRPVAGRRLNPAIGNLDFSRRLREFVNRWWENLSIRKFADRVGVHRNSAQTYFKDGSVPRLNTLVRICQVYNINAHWLLTGEGPKHRPAENMEVSQKMGQWEMRALTTDLKRSAMYRFEVYKDKKGAFRFRFMAPNGHFVFFGEGYKTKQGAKKAIESIKKNAPGAEIKEQQSNVTVRAGRRKPRR